MTTNQPSQKSEIILKVIFSTIFFFLAALCAMLMAISLIATGVKAAHSDDDVTKSGTAVATRCWADGPLFINFWESCDVNVTWDDGTTSTTTPRIGDFNSDDIGQPERVNFVQSRISQAGGTYDWVAKDISRPWSWLGWILPAPFAGAGMLCFICGVLFLIPVKPDKKKRKKKQQNKATAKQH